MKHKIDINLERDPVFKEAREKLTKVGAELRAAEMERDLLQQGLGALAQLASDKLDAEAAAVLAGETPETQRREVIMQSIAQVDRRIVVLRHAVWLQRQVVESLTARVSREICTEKLPTHRANVAAVIKAAMALAEACRVERELREDLEQNGVSYLGTLRPMPMYGFDTRDPNGRFSQYIREAVEFGFMTIDQAPEPLRAHIPPAAKSQASEPPPTRSQAARTGWLNA